jgi:hypothetical protein
MTRRPIFTRGLLVALALAIGIEASAQNVCVGCSGLPKGIPDFGLTTGCVTVSGTENWSGTKSAPCYAISGVVNVGDGTTINTRMILVYEDGELNIGSAGDPATGVTITIQDETLDTDGMLRGEADPEQFDSGIICLGKCWFHGTVKAPRAKFTAAVSSGATSITFDRTLTGWAAGDVIALTHPHEYLTIDSIVGTTVTFTGATTSAHAAFSSSAVTYPNSGSVSSVTDYAWVGNVTRSILIQSENPEGTRGHFMASQRADVDVRYVAFNDMGRTDALIGLDSTTFSGATVTHVGTNQIGRYSIHMHHLYGPEPGSMRPYQYVLEGNVILRDSKWGIAIHNTHYGLVEGNVCVINPGACYVEEDGGETANEWIDNLASELINESAVAPNIGGTPTAACTSTVGNYDPQGRCASGFWMRGNNHVMTGNVVANALRGVGWWTLCLEVDEGHASKCGGTEHVTKPIEPGADTSDPENILTCLNAASAPDFCRVIHSVGLEVDETIIYDSDNCMDFWWVIRTRFDSEDITDTHCWENRFPLILQYTDAAFDRLNIYGAEQSAIFKFNDGASNGFGASYFTVLNGDFRDIATYCYQRTGQLWLAPLVRFEDTKCESTNGFQLSVHGQNVVGYPTSYMYLDNVRQAGLNGGTLNTLTFAQSLVDVGINPMVPIPHTSELTVTDYQGSPGDNFTITMTVAGDGSDELPFDTCVTSHSAEMTGYTCDEDPPDPPGPSGFRLPQRIWRRP